MALHYLLIMNITSHFIGLEVDGASFKQLFEQLLQYRDQSALHDVIEPQAYISLHITLYYLPSDLGASRRTEILQHCRQLSTHAHSAIRSSLHLGYFGLTGNEKVCFIAPNEDKMFHVLHRSLEERFRDDSIFENRLSFTPHITLFRIKDSNVFQTHKNELEEVIKTYIDKIFGTSLGDVRLYAVDSSMHPEMQVPVG